MKRIALTGCTKGLGLALWRAFATRGHAVAGCGRSAPPEPPAPPHRFDQVDVGDDGAVAVWAESVLADGPVDLVVNNAGVINRPAPLWELDAAECDELLRVNVSGTINVIRHFVPALIARGSGMVVNFSSGWGRSTAAEVAPYCASKWAVEAISQAMAQELPAGIGVVAYNPGVIHTGMLETVWGEGAAEFEDPAAWAEHEADRILDLSPA